ncbi:hypothetical protein HWQ46_11095 [Shewanella sp. D64]|uniref:hypothetical protein n=1 Tax=unclassified Shewanella TaxID=196818 RepID=UPI0022BA6E3F|nr:MULTISPECIES: hypothetical protein [unclassified Shewanella]MEC4726094.1 hypothetical protein [Shewanella sp. D64]MEC4737990.1 hypothetical protein [Shewanella sp. E94]WBJ96189.1 hypothetical protein HWQ47_03385 [Shewanella sp. MTB7]
MSNNQSLIQRSSKKPVYEFLRDISEMGLDQAIPLVTDGQLLKELPIIKWLFLGNEVHSSIQSVFFLKKYAHFIGPIVNYRDEDIEELLLVVGDDKTQEKIVDQTLIYLDRFHTEFKAKLLGELFVQN